MKDRELLRAERVCDMGHGRVDLSPRKVGGGLNIILLYFNTSFFRMSLDPLRTVNMVEAKDEGLLDESESHGREVQGKEEVQSTAEEEGTEITVGRSPSGLLLATREALATETAHALG